MHIPNDLMSLGRILFFIKFALGDLFIYVLYRKKNAVLTYLFCILAVIDLTKIIGGEHQMDIFFGW